MLLAIFGRSHGSALFLEDVFPDGWTLRLGDGAEGLTPGVAAKREESPLLIRATQGEQDTKAVSENHVYFLQKPRKSDETRPGALSRHLMGLHLEPSQFQVAVKWWLGLDTSGDARCVLCPEMSFDPLGHHATTCKRGGDVVYRHNRLRNNLAESCRRAHLSVHLEVGHNLTPDNSNTRPADILIPHWCMGRPAALDLSVSSPLNPLTLLEAGVMAGAAAKATEERKLKANTGKCADLGWVCVPFVAESHGAWGLTARDFFSKLESRLATSLRKSKSVVTHELYGRMSTNLVRANATAILSRSKTLSSKFDDHLFNNLLTISSLADKARQMSISSPHASAWLSVTPSEGLGLHLDPPVFQIAVKWWLGLDTSEGSQCTLCPGVLDHLGHHAVTCKYGGDVVSRHNKIRDILVETCRRKPAALDVSIISPLNPLTLLEAGVLAKSAAPVTEAMKHQANDPKCSELGWVCVPMVAESYGAWGDEASSIISSIASRLATSTCKSKPTERARSLVGEEMAPVPRKLAERIWRWEFVEMSEMVAESWSQKVDELSAGIYQYMEDLLALDHCRATPDTWHVPLQNGSYIVTPLGWVEWDEVLNHQPDQQFIANIVSGLRQGFRVGFDYAHSGCQRASSNMHSARKHAQVIREYLAVECSEGRVVGPLNPPWSQSIQISRFGVIPRGSTVDRAAESVVQLGRGALMAKIDIKAAYRLIPVHPADRWLLGMQFEGAIFMDTVLPFGSRYAPKIFNAVANALEWACRNNGVGNMLHYLDDFMVLGAPDSSECADYLMIVRSVFQRLGVPITEHKTAGPLPVMTFLGVEIDSEQLTLRLPEEKLT
ncbi:hypothetical protein EMCRGX_G015066 [Ephydatia muelleri]